MAPGTVDAIAAVNQPAVKGWRGRGLPHTEPFAESDSVLPPRGFPVRRVWIRRGGLGLTGLRRAFLSSPYFSVGCWTLPVSTLLLGIWPNKADFLTPCRGLHLGPQQVF